MTLPCGCYDFTVPRLRHDDAHEHCWHTQYDVRLGAERSQCGRCGKWADLFDGPGVDNPALKSDTSGR